MTMYERRFESPGKLAGASASRIPMPVTCAVCFGVGAASAPAGSRTSPASSGSAIKQRRTLDQATEWVIVPE